LFNPIFFDHFQEYGKGTLKAMKLDGLSMLARLYWYTVKIRPDLKPSRICVFTMQGFFHRAAKSNIA